MEKESNILEALFARLISYIETNVELFKLKAVHKMSDIISSVIGAIILLIVAVPFFILLNIGLALWIGHLLDCIYYGFFIMAGFYFIVGLIFYLLRNKVIKKPLVDVIIKKLLR